MCLFPEDTQHVVGSLARFRVNNTQREMDKGTERNIQGMASLRTHTIFLGIEIRGMFCYPIGLSLHGALP